VRFSDGIMRAIEFRLKLDRRTDPKGDRVELVLSGKYLPCEATRKTPHRPCVRHHLLVPKGPGWAASGQERPTPAIDEVYFLLRVKFLVTVDFFLIVTVATVGWKPSLATMTVSGLLRTSSQRAYPPLASVVSV
jgi:hypothetical protein